MYHVSRSPTMTGPDCMMSTRSRDEFEGIELAVGARYVVSHTDRNRPADLAIRCGFLMGMDQPLGLADIGGSRRWSTPIAVARMNRA